LNSNPCEVMITSTNDWMIIFHLSSPIDIMVTSNQRLI
jgi:hypothetical protein